MIVISDKTINNKIVLLTTRVVHQYKTMKLIYLKTNYLNTALEMQI